MVGGSGYGSVVVFVKDSPGLTLPRVLIFRRPFMVVCWVLEICGVKSQVRFRFRHSSEAV